MQTRGADTGACGAGAFPHALSRGKYLLADLLLTLAPQSDSRKQHVEQIQSLEEWVQRELMWSIEQVRLLARHASAACELTPPLGRS